MEGEPTAGLCKWRWGHKEGERQDGRAQGRGYKEGGFQGYRSTRLEGTMTGAQEWRTQGRRGTWKETQIIDMHTFLLSVCFLVPPLQELCRVQLPPITVTFAELSLNSAVLLQPSVAHKLPPHSLRHFAALCAALHLPANRLYCRLHYQHLAQILSAVPQ